MTPLPTITIRPGYADDELTLAQLAALDSAAAPPPAPVLIAEVDGRLRAALSLRDGTAIADPFFPTVDVLDLMRTRATAARPPAPRRRLRRLRLQPARA